MKYFNHPLILGIILCIFVWLCAVSYMLLPMITVPSEKQEGYNQSDSDKMDKFVAFQIKQPDSHDIEGLIGREGVK